LRAPTGKAARAPGLSRGFDSTRPADRRACRSTGTVPLAETSEAYEVEILNGEEVVRTLSTSTLVGAGGVGALAGLEDTDLAGAVTNDYLRYTGSSWVPSALELSGQN
jgi:hypothetical protein